MNAAQDAFLRTGVIDMALLTEEKMNKPSIWNQALKAVKGDSMNEMVERWTAC